jgi:PAS domain S-box-containing protein
MNNPPAEKNRRILIIDDNHAIHDDFRKILSPATTTAAALDVTEAELFGKLVPHGGMVQQIRYEIDSAYQGQEGVLLVKQALEAGHPYAMAFVDVRMPPGMDGVETTRKMWELDPDLQVVLCTAYSDYSWGEMFEKLGHHDGLLILKKPFDTVEALQLTHALTEKWWLHQQSRQKMEGLEGLVAGRTQELANSLSLLNATLESTTDGILAMDLKGNVTSLNAKFAALWQFPAELMKRQNRAEMVPFVSRQLKDPERFLQRIKQSLSDPETETFEVIECKDGRILERHSLPQRIDGKCVGVVVNWRDVTERNRAEAALRENEERFSGAFEFAPIGVALVTPDGHYLKVNRALCELVGYSEAELLTHTFQDITHPEDLEVDLENVRRLLAGETRSYQMEKRYVHARGHLVTVLLNVSLVRDDQGQPRYFVSQVQDITERKRLEAELNRERDLWRTLLDNSPDHIYFKDTQSRFIRASKAQALQFGVKSPDEMVGRTDFDFFTEAHARPAFEDEQEIIRTGEPMIAKEEREVWKDGHVTWASSTKMPMRDHTGKIIGIMGISRDVTGRKRAEEALATERQLLSSLITATPDTIYFKDRESRFIRINEAFARRQGLSDPSAALGKTDFDLFGEQHAREAYADEQRIVATGQPMIDKEEREDWKDGHVTWVSSTKMPLLDGTGKIIGLMGISRDITERKRLEAHLLQSQKMETVGKLAGGIAHEFNSILTAIIGQSELLLGDLPAGSPLAQNAAEITKAADRAATLTRQLLAYGRKQFLRPEALNLNQVITSMDGVLSHLMGGEMVDVNIVPATGLKAVKADTGQVEQVIMNLAMNARDAMPHGGKLTLETANVLFDQDSVGRNPELKPGAYVMLAITDTGRGMSEKVKAHAFEPFFTTKDVGQGTGLGLSTCYGIIKQSGGHINVYSEPGRGTTFKIYLPQVEPPTKIPIERLDSPDLPRGTETILLVEDDPALREMAAALLRRLGYTVLVAANGIEALSLKQQRDIGHVDLLFTDVVMPHMSGKELSERVRALYPHTRILFTSAYTENAIVHQGVLDKGVALLQKPFTPSALALKVREALDQPGAPKPDAAPKTSGLTKSSDEAMTPGN